jgi:hypothetical protein
MKVLVYIGSGLLRLRRVEIVWLPTDPGVRASYTPIGPPTYVT